MGNVTKDTLVFCPDWNEFFLGSIQLLKEDIQDQDEFENYQKVTVLIANRQPFMTVNDEWLIDLIQREVERQGCDNERSSESGDEMYTVEQLLLKHTKVDYKSIMEEMPQLYYHHSSCTELEIDLNDF